ncbi:unnamed protein product [Rotaria socialis]|uniref:Uncharacterized protein n=1 Tax=Rotaria socialis TaxID=392032 RepID=A0A817UAG4_9BILA|nr:unnamed protein product [Rotaria socialis]CAF3330227.1 unnamed protein product [Rotaria socialis]CAF3356036.1 unnamed protein product [Rotaria socialis]CAF3459292.1 unnamed protein product [Rotaria socialis]CAF3473629.1 unnamed protein product [Rotaria socialis]
MGNSQSQKQSKNCQAAIWNNMTASHLANPRGPPYLAYIISGIPQRHNSTRKQLRDALPGFFNFNHKQPVSLNDSRILRTVDMKVSSLLLTYIDLWNDIGARSPIELRENDWIFLFEDDVAIIPRRIMKSFYKRIYEKWRYRSPNPNLAKTIEQALELAKNDGILYLGTCGSAYVNSSTGVSYSRDGLIEFRRGTHFCTHAIAYMKWRARRMWDDLAVYRLFHNAFGADTIANHWQKLSKTYPFCIAPNIHWPPGTGHHGFFFQDRGTHTSTIQ